MVKIKGGKRNEAVFLYHEQNSLLDLQKEREVDIFLFPFDAFFSLSLVCVLSSIIIQISNQSIDTPSHQKSILKNCPP